MHPQRSFEDAAAVVVVVVVANIQNYLLNQRVVVVVVVVVDVAAVVVIGSAVGMNAKVVLTATVVGLFAQQFEAIVE